MLFVACTGPRFSVLKEDSRIRINSGENFTFRPPYYHLRITLIQCETNAQPLYSRALIRVISENETEDVWIWEHAFSRKAPVMVSDISTNAATFDRFPQLKW